MNVNSTKPPENQNNQNLVKWVTRHVLHSCSDLWFFWFFLLFSMVLLYFGAAPLVCLVFLVFSMVFISLAFAAPCYHVSGKGKGLGAGAGHRYARQPIYSYGWLREGTPVWRKYATREMIQKLSSEPLRIVLIPMRAWGLYRISCCVIQLSRNANDTRAYYQPVTINIYVEV